eukprot:gnl/TRDRNA2_/TRDRNA2_140423_c1_seq1.p1 gnl/TRDRNA2_/TRDRNA2_140423_c1~~gnl/TRDRNA2_/TRDRNA2_140423_c1_seq1.p1  ORF type:complete len:113 (-),score=13.26 gnl/TRDRNA2_/TRDRNA2_140423_c1_seq1:105-443(-)
MADVGESQCYAGDFLRIELVDTSLRYARQDCKHFLVRLACLRQCECCIGDILQIDRHGYAARRSLHQLCCKQHVVHMADVGDGSHYVGDVMRIELVKPPLRYCRHFCKQLVI